MHQEQTVSEMVEEILTRQAKALVERTGQPFQSALEAVSKTDAGSQLRELANGEHGNERARDLRDTWNGWRAKRRARNITRA